jgi:hypothetical protein
MKHGFAFRMIAAFGEMLSAHTIMKHKSSDEEGYTRQAGRKKGDGICEGEDAGFGCFG